MARLHSCCCSLYSNEPPARKARLQFNFIHFKLLCVVFVADFIWACKLYNLMFIVILHCNEFRSEPCEGRNLYRCSYKLQSYTITNSVSHRNSISQSSSHTSRSFLIQLMIRVELKEDIKNCSILYVVLLHYRHCSVLALFNHLQAHGWNLI